MGRNAKNRQWHCRMRIWAVSAGLQARPFSNSRDLTS